MTSRTPRLARELLSLRAAFENWVPVAVAGLLWKFLPLPRRDLVVKSRNGARLVVPLTKDAGALHPVLQIFAFAAYEADWRLEDAPHIVDIGANVGAFTVWLAERYPGLTGACYEPDPDACSYLRRNVAGLDVAVRPVAVADRTGEAVLVRDSACSGTSSLQVSARAASETGIDVDVVAFDDVMAHADRPVGLLKLDCEGSEYGIVLRSRAEAWQLVQRVVVEYHAVDEFEPSELLERFRLLGFALVRQQEETPASGTYWLCRDHPGVQSKR